MTQVEVLERRVVDLQALVARLEADLAAARGDWVAVLGEADALMAARSGLARALLITGRGELSRLQQAAADVALALRMAIRQGADVDEPEGARFVVLSDTAVEALAFRLVGERKASGEVAGE